MQEDMLCFFCTSTSAAAASSIIIAAAQNNLTAVLTATNKQHQYKHELHSLPIVVLSMFMLTAQWGNAVGNMRLKKHRAPEALAAITNSASEAVSWYLELMKDTTSDNSSTYFASLS